jgi:hypothetical protein
MLAGAITITSHDFADRVDLGVARAGHVNRIREEAFAQDKAVKAVLINIFSYDLVRAIPVCSRARRCM